MKPNRAYGRWLWLGRPCSDGTATHPTQHSSRAFNLQQDCSVVSGVLDATGWTTVIEDAATRSLFQRLQVIQLPSQGLFQRLPALDAWPFDISPLIAGIHWGASMLWSVPHGMVASLEAQSSCSCLSTTPSDPLPRQLQLPSTATCRDGEALCPLGAPAGVVCLCSILPGYGQRVGEAQHPCSVGLAWRCSTSNEH